MNKNKSNEYLFIFFLVLAIVVGGIACFFIFILAMSYIWLPDDGGSPVSARNEILYYVELAGLFFIFFLVAAINRYTKIFKTKKIKNKIANSSKCEPIIRESSGSFGFLKRLKK